MKPPNALRSDEWTVRTCALRDAILLIREHHYARGASNTAVYRHGLYKLPTSTLDQPMGAAVWLPPTKAAAVATCEEGEDWRGVLALSRLVVHPDCPANAASFLMAASMRMVDRERWPVLVTYADTRMGHTGAIYRATNWREVGATSAGGVWVDAEGTQRGRKRGPRNLTRAEMISAGFTQCAPAPKIKFVHRVAS